MTGIQAVVRKMNMSLAPKLCIGGYFIYNPNEDSFRQLKRKVNPYPVKITEGFFLDSTYGRVSNFWSWKRVLPNGQLSRRTESGYGGDEPVFKKVSRATAIKKAVKNGK